MPLSFVLIPNLADSSLSLRNSKFSPLGDFAMRSNGTRIAHRPCVNGLRQPENAPRTKSTDFPRVPQRRLRVRFGSEAMQ
jgi:hypothetical protein